MRIMLLGTAAIALSGCSWLGGSSYHGAYGGGEHGYYAGGAAPQAEECCGNLSKWNLEGAVGAEFMVDGDFTTPGDVAALAALTPGDISMKDAYDDGTRYELGFSKALNPNRKFTVMGSYATADGNDVGVGTLAGPPANTLRGTASDYERYGIEAGLRQYFRPTPAPLVRSLRPYVEGKLGAAKVKDIDLENARDNVGAVNGGTIAMYEGGWVPTAAGMIGVEAPIFKRATLGLETGIRYTGKLDTDTTYFNGGNVLNGINNGSESWTVPVMLRGRYRF